jgi:predicted RNA-binding protein YlqC (UPF0109 family)
MDELEIVRIAKLLTWIVQEIVDYSEDVVVTSVSQPSGVLFRVMVSETDLGKVIGKDGRTARSLRTVLMAIGMKAQNHIGLDIAKECIGV